MTTPLQPNQPWQLQLKPEQWHGVLMQAIQDLHTNPRDQEALNAVRDANEALSVYDEAEAASPGERISSGVSGGVQGLGQAAMDIPLSVLQTALHPIQTVQNLPKIPGQLAEGFSSGDPAQIARSVGNIGGMALPFAKVGGTTVGGMAGRVASAPFQAGAELLRRPGLANAASAAARDLAMTRQQAANQAAAHARATAQRAAAAGPVQQALLETRLDLLKQRLSSGGEGVPTEMPIEPLSVEAMMDRVAQTGKVPIGSNPLDALRQLPDEALGQTPLFEASAAAPEALNAQIAKLVQSMMQKK